MNKKIVLFLAFVSLMSIIYSCSDEENIPEIKPEYPVKLVYTQKIEIVDFKLYVGSPEGGKEILSEFTSPEKIWGTRMTLYNHPDTILFISQDSIQHLPNFVSVDRYLYKWEKDSLYGYNPYAGEWELYGVGTKQRLEYKMAFEKMIIVEEGSFFTSIGQNHGIYSDLFFKHLLPEMTNIKDTIAWCNVSYIYEVSNAP